MRTKASTQFMQKTGVALFVVLLYLTLFLSAAQAAGFQDTPQEAEGMSLISIFILAKFGILLTFALAMLAHLFGIIRLPWMRANSTVSQSAD